MIINWFLPDTTTFDEQTFTNVKIVTYLLAFLTISCTVLSFVETFIVAMDEEFPYFAVACMGFLLLLIFKKTGSIAIVGNALVLVVFLALASTSLQNGGIFSGDYQSLFLVPLMGFVLVGYRSGFVWLVVYLLFSFYLWSLVTNENESLFRQQTLSLNSTYYFLGGIFITLFVGATVSIFHFQNKQLVKQLNIHRADLKESNALLAKQTSLLKAAQENLKRSNIELEEYANATSHDLKQPLRTISSFANLLQRHLTKQHLLDKRSEEFLNFILTGTANMERLVTDLLAFGKLKSSKNNSFELMSLDKVLDRVLVDIRNQVESNDVIIERAQLPSLKIIPVKFNQLLQNLISNAIKFKKKEEQLVLKIGAVEKEQHWQLSIADNGIGIEEQFLEKIFAPFKKLHSSAEYEGSGIGLATCKHIVELHKGKLWVQSKYGVGTIFYFTIPKDLKEKETNKQLFALAV